MTANIILSGGPLAGDIIPIDDPIADTNGEPGTVIDLTYDEARINDSGEPVLVSVPCSYRVTNLTTRRIGGRTVTSGQAVYCG